MKALEHVLPAVWEPECWGLGFCRVEDTHIDTNTAINYSYEVTHQK